MGVGGVLVGVDVAVLGVEVADVVAIGTTSDTSGGLVRSAASGKKPIPASANVPEVKKTIASKKNEKAKRDILTPSLYYINERDFYKIY